MEGLLEDFKKSLGEYREWCLPPRKQSCTVDRWVIQGENGSITGHSLRQQRGYSQHECGRWSRNKDGESENSLR